MFGFNAYCVTPFCTLPTGAVVVVTPPGEEPFVPASYALGPSQMWGTPDGRRRKREIDEAVAAIMRMWMGR